MPFTPPPSRTRSADRDAVGLAAGATGLGADAALLAEVDGSTGVVIVGSFAQRQGFEHRNAGSGALDRPVSRLARSSSNAAG
jgi:hypothetical protein